MQAQEYMQRALALAEAHIGATAENPSVGCVIVKGGNILGEGVTGIGGRPHAEATALKAAGKNAQGSDVYVTLEPCSHYGKTPPCAEALIDAKVARVFIACLDPDARVSGRGIAMLRAAGIEVEIGLCEAEAAHQHRGFFRRLVHGLPHVRVKLATSADGFMGVESSGFITGETARTHGQSLRANVGAIITGVQTVIDDDPKLTCRIPGLEGRNPVRIILDRSLRTPLDRYVVKTAEEIPTYLFTSAEAMQTSAALDLRERGVNLVITESLPEVLREAAKLSLTHVLIEAGPTLSQAFLQANLVDELYWYSSRQTLGSKGTNRLSVQLNDSPASSSSLAEDTLTVYQLASCLPD